MTTSFQLVQRLRNAYSLLRDEGISSGDYLEQLTYLLFLKMNDEYIRLPYGSPPRLPTGYDWHSLLSLDGLPLGEHYSEILKRLGDEQGMPGVIFRNAVNRIQDPTKLRRLIVDVIDQQQWGELGIALRGSTYEGLLEQYAEDLKTGAGQYYTPRALIKAIVEVMQPQPGMRICDPACGTGGFLLAAHDYIGQHYQLTRRQAQDLKEKTFFGWEVVDHAARLGTMNLFLHDIGSDDLAKSPITVADSLLKSPDETFDLVLSTPPFGRKSCMTMVIEERKEQRDRLKVARPDFVAETSNKQLNFIQHIITLIKPSGRAAVVVPDNVLFEGGAGEKIRQNLLWRCDVHTLLRLPTGIFYAQGVKANVLFFDRMPSSNQPWTKELWIYDFRTNQHFTVHTRPLKREHLDDFVRCYHPENRSARHETERFRTCSYDELVTRDRVNLDLFWLRDDRLDSADDLPSLEEETGAIIHDLKAALELARGMIQDHLFRE